MPLVPQPSWADFADPGPPDTSGASDCQALAAANLDGLDAAADDLGGNIVSAGAALTNGAAFLNSIGDALATSASVAVSLDDASLLLDPSPYVDAANSLMDALGSDLDAATSSMADVDFTPFDPGAGPVWAGGTQIPTYTPPAGGGDSGIPKIFFPIAVTQSSPAFVGMASATIGGILGVLAPVAVAFMLFNSLFGFDLNAQFAEYSAAMQAWARSDPIGFGIWQAQQEIASDQAALGTVGSYQHAQLLVQIARLQKMIDGLEQMKYVTS
jgi:hypothetical protein